MQNATIWTTLFAVPLIWILHLLLCLTLVAHACGGGVAQSDELQWSDAQYVIDAASAGAFVVCVALAIAAGRTWRRLSWLANGRPNLACFIAWCSTLSAIAFTVVLTFVACVMIAAPFDRLCAPFQ
jgi:hypothetical protein